MTTPDLQPALDERQRRLAEMIRIACVLEATARKPGNVHPQAAFADLRYVDFVRAAAAAAPALARAGAVGVGRAVWDAVDRTRAESGTNVNLGIALLIAPLAAVPPDRSLTDGIEDVLAALDQADAAFVYRAIRLARPGGLGESVEEDVAGEPTRPLRKIMALAAERDAVAGEYAAGFPLILRLGLPFLQQADDFAKHWEEALIGLHLRLMADRPDTLIARKCGTEVAEESSRRAARVLATGWPCTRAGRDEIARLDAWLRAEGNRRNPGTTADLVAATAFAALREGAIAAPPRVLRP